MPVRKISVVTVCWNPGEIILEAIRSVQAQDFADVEHVIIDGGSTDGTPERVARLLRPGDVLVSEPDKGIYDAMNKGLALFSGDAIGFLNSDDIYHNQFALEHIAKGLETADAVYGDLIMISDHVSRKIARSWHAGSFMPGAFRNGWMPPHPTFYIRRALASRVGHFDVSYRISADYDFMLRALEIQRKKNRWDSVNRKIHWHV